MVYDFHEDKEGSLMTWQDFSVKVGDSGCRSVENCRWKKDCENYGRFATNSLSFNYSTTESIWHHLLLGRKSDILAAAPVHRAISVGVSCWMLVISTNRKHFNQPGSTADLAYRYPEVSTSSELNAYRVLQRCGFGGGWRDIAAAKVDWYISWFDISSRLKGPCF